MPTFELDYNALRYILVGLAVLLAIAWIHIWVLHGTKASLARHVKLIEARISELRQQNRDLKQQLERAELQHQDFISANYRERDSED